MNISEMKHGSATMLLYWRTVEEFNSIGEEIRKGLAHPNIPTLFASRITSQRPLPDGSWEVTVEFLPKARV